MLGCGVVGYFVGVYKEGKPFPNSEDLDAWQQALESVAEGKEDFALPLRLIRTGIAFIKQGGTDESILLTLTTPEREILRQALGLSNPVEWRRLVGVENRDKPYPPSFAFYPSSMLDAPA